MRSVLFFLFAVFACCCLPQSELLADELRIESNPSGATVEIDGKVAGVTPYVRKVPGGYFHKTATVFGERLERPLHARLSLKAHVSQDVDLTVGPIRWVALNGVDHGAYYLIKDRVISVSLVPEPTRSESRDA
jgi:hypothetical protein